MTQPQVEEIRIGPYTQGEIPSPIVYTFQARLPDGQAGDPINLTTFTAKLVYRCGDLDPVYADATVTAPTDGEVTYWWVDGDTGTAGEYAADLWVGNGGSLRYAAVRFVWEVAAAVAPAPDI